MNNRKQCIINKKNSFNNAVSIMTVSNNGLELGQRCGSQFLLNFHIQETSFHLTEKLHYRKM